MCAMEWAVAHFHKTADRVTATEAGARRSWWTLIQMLFNHYQPERHYMRGPGPKWRQKHGGRGSAEDGRRAT
jgi:hypothetical protein